MEYKKSIFYGFNLVCVKMRFSKQSIDIPVSNGTAWDPAIKSETRRHSPLLPNTIRCIIAGPSNCGKTNLLVNLIISENGLKFENVYVYSKTLWQSKYKYLRELLGAIPEIGYFEFSSSDELIEPTEAKANSIIIFDDVICEKNQDTIRNYYSLGRHRSVDSFYLTTTYTRVGKHLIRDNCNFLIVFRQDELNLKHIYNDMGVGCHMKFDLFQKFCFECWGEQYGFVVIDLC